MAQSGLAGQRSQLHKFENGLRVAAGCGLWHNLSIGKRIEQCGGATRALADAGCSNSKSAGHDIVAGALLLVGKAGFCLVKKLDRVGALLLMGHGDWWPALLSTFGPKR